MRCHGAKKWQRESQQTSLFSRRRIPTASRTAVFSRSRLVASRLRYVPRHGYSAYRRRPAHPAPRALAGPRSELRDPGLIRDLERLQILLAARLMRETWQAIPGTRSNTALEDLQHLTPTRVAELLNLTEPYVHELCRTGRIEATKSGKYWMIPVAGLRQWLAYQNRDVDGGAQPRVESRSPRGGIRPRSTTGPAGRPRRSLMT